MTAQNTPQNKTPGEITRIAAGIGVSALTAVMLILAMGRKTSRAGNQQPC